AFCSRNVLVPEKTETSRCSKASTGAIAEPRTGRVCGVLDYQKTMLFGHRAQPIHICRNAGVMHRHHGLRARCDLSRRIIRTHGWIFKIADIDEQWPLAAVKHY